MNTPVAEFESSLEAAARDFDAASFVRESDDLQTLKTRLTDRGMSDESAQNLCERLVRSLVSMVGEDLGTALEQSLERLLSVQRRVMRLYDAARQSTHLPSNFATDMADLLRQREQLFEQIRLEERNHPTDPQNMDRYTLDTVAGSEEAGTPLAEEQLETPGLTETEETAAAPRVTQAVRADLQQAAAGLRARAGIRPDIRVGFMGMKGTAFSRRYQFEGFAADDPEFAGRGAEATFRLPGEPRDISVDGMLWEDPGRSRFRLGEFKAADPAEGRQSIYTDLEFGSEEEGSFRDQIARLLNLCDQLGPACTGITYRTNTAQSVEALTMLIDSIYPRDSAEAARIRIEGPLP